MPYGLHFQKSPRLQLRERLPKLLLRIHHDRAVPRDRLLERFPRAQQEPDALLARLHRELIALIEQHQRPVLRLRRRVRIRPSDPLGRHLERSARIAKLPRPAENRTQPLPASPRRPASCPPPPAPSRRCTSDPPRCPPPAPACPKSSRRR